MIFSRSTKLKIFCISFQRTGTTSVGQFFRDQGYKVAGYHRKRSSEWSKLRFIGDFESIFKSRDFKSHQVFEDNPWWEGDFYKILFHRFPDSKYILFTRNPDKWFNSMLSHSHGKTLGNTFMHSKLYRRELEFYKLYPTGEYYKTIKSYKKKLELREINRQHYIDVYNLRNKEIIDFFNFYDPSRLIHLELEDPNKWKKLGAFFRIEVPKGYKCHWNKTN